MTVTEDTLHVDSIQAADMKLDSNADQAGRSPDITWYPSGVKNKAYTLVSGDPNIAAISGALVIPIHKGSATVTVTTDDGAKTAAFKVEVRGKPDPGG